MAVFTGAMVVLAAYYSLKLFRIWEETETLLTIVKSLTVFGESFGFTRRRFERAVG